MRPHYKQFSDSLLNFNNLTILLWLSNNLQRQGRGTELKQATREKRCLTSNWCMWRYITRIELPEIWKVDQPDGSYCQLLQPLADDLACWPFLKPSFLSKIFLSHSFPSLSFLFHNKVLLLSYNISNMPARCCCIIPLRGGVIVSGILILVTIFRAYPLKNRSLSF